MNARPALDATQIDPKAASKIAEFQAEVLREVKETVARGGVVVVGMAQNPHVKNVRKALNAAKVPFTYLEYGSYFSAWRQRLAIKLWSGWPTFPQVFVNGVLLGGEELTTGAIADGSLQARLGGSRAS
jgi:glutaredoxin-related protein